ncbi:MAG TPA: acetyl-lysine deacetylase, partial [Thermoplasmata archaeon]|nr:acetyl-lysine deacetylase [Thermoplasmata archaeon]
MDDVGILTALVEEYSPSGHEAGAVQRFIDSARSLGFTAHADAAGNGIARIGEGPPSIMFLGHIDTVEGRLPVRFEGDRLHG